MATALAFETHHDAITGLDTVRLLDGDHVLAERQMNLMQDVDRRDWASAQAHMAEHDRLTAEQVSKPLSVPALEPLAERAFMAAAHTLFPGAEFPRKTPASAPDEPKRCEAETAGYDGLWGVYCNLSAGHDGPHNDGFVEWSFVGDDPWRAKPQDDEA